MATEKKAEAEVKEKSKKAKPAADAPETAKTDDPSKPASERPERVSRPRTSNTAQRKPYRRFYRRRQKQVVPAYVDWKDVEYLERFVPERGKIMPRRISGVSAKDQRRIARAIKRARVMALLPYVGD